jgi:hypothetical protein
MKYLFLISSLVSLSYNCNLQEISKTHFLYKEDNVNEVKWLEKTEYCRAKGDLSVYSDAGQGKCEYSRGLCYWYNESCLNTYREYDNLEECVNLLLNNVLVPGLDNGRLKVIDNEFTSSIPTTTMSTETTKVPPKPKSIVSQEIRIRPFFILI